jgi:dynein heavy chain
MSAILRYSFCFKYLHEYIDIILQIESVMKSSLKSVMAEAVKSYSGAKRVDWVLDWPGQVVLAGDLIYWTSEVTEV